MPDHEPVLNDLVDHSGLTSRLTGQDHFALVALKINELEVINGQLTCPMHVVGSAPMIDVVLRWSEFLSQDDQTGWAYHVDHMGPAGLITCGI